MKNKRIDLVIFLSLKKKELHDIFLSSYTVCEI